MSEAVADWSGDRDYSGGDNNSGAQNVGDGDVQGPMIGPGGQFIGVNGDAPQMTKFAEHLTITTVSEPGKPVQSIAIRKLRKWPTPAGAIGVISGVITIAGVLPGAETYRQVVAFVNEPDAVVAGPWGTPMAAWWLLATFLVVAVGTWGLGRWWFLRKHVLWLPRSSWRRARAGIRAKNGRTYPCSIRLAARCRICNSKMRFYSKMVNWVDHFDAQGNRTKRVGTRWEPRAECKLAPEDPNHCASIDVTQLGLEKPIH
ncbi:hypothetical protein [Cellulosimicrobium cellulans]|uniref:hypothetical protein n=1 Tax=Cellulosimicrobium cellulans TaxID=1710 RepID=UPI0024058C71|nr:hypothetical protein [Cellulosimicrobium cellulans]MDF9877784.1 hypothetical protein [Cellulosimicrobium cellulans]